MPPGATSAPILSGLVWRGVNLHATARSIPVPVLPHAPRKAITKYQCARAGARARIQGSSDGHCYSLFGTFKRLAER